MNKPLNIELMEELIDSYKTIENLKEENKRLHYNIKIMEEKLRDCRENNPITKEALDAKVKSSEEANKKSFMNTGCSAGQNPDKDSTIVRDDDSFIKAVFDALVK